MNYQEIANEFLNQWESEHSVDQPNYSQLAASYAVFTGQVSFEDADAIEKALHAARVARGWPDPKPAPSGFMSFEPTIEGAIMTLWLRALYTSAVDARYRHG
jgi:hypothetical protein